MRRDRDAYLTPPWCYELLEPFINWDKVYSFLEPCSGDGRIINWIKLHIEQDHIESYEIRDKSDYLAYNRIVKSDLIITNPPYSLAMRFVSKGIKESVCSFWLLRLAFLASQQRRQFFLDNPLSALIVLSKRPSFTGIYTDNSDYGWFVWDKDNICNVRGIVHTK